MKEMSAQSDGTSRRESYRLALLVIALIAVIGLVVFSAVEKLVFAPARERVAKAKTSEAIVQLSELNLALSSYEIDIGVFPTTTEGLMGLIQKPQSGDDWEGPYAQRIEDPWGNPWQYACPGTHDKNYDLYSFGPDGKDGTGDDITSWNEDNK